MAFSKAWKNQGEIFHCLEEQPHPVSNSWKHTWRAFDNAEFSRTFSPVKQHKE
jgi:hypothetical protein